ncbi:hypothetical protein [Marinilactibacillus sp. 15R]|nr:hypothetical protein [Marinilactibacillus sp. 15R]
MKFIISLLIVLIFIVFIGLSKGSREYIIGPNNDERRKAIKQKSIV